MRGTTPVRTAEHSITPERIDPDAYKVLRRLNQLGYHGYLVGGGVRDLLLDRAPKDFDVATSARPHEVRKIFRNCRLIGRRFRLAHILFAGGKVIETATFRAEPLDNDEDGELITDDNVFGTPESDAHRRDFTINALFYDPETNEVIDYCGGLPDLASRTLRTIGDPVVRFREDPVRMLRAVKFAARLDLNLHPDTRDAVLSEGHTLSKAAVPRLHEEILRMMRGTASRRSIELLAELELLDLLLPEVAAYLGRPTPNPWADLAPLLDALDDACAAWSGEPPPSLLLGALYWPMFRAVLNHLPRRPGVRDLQPIAESLVAPMAVRLRVPRRQVGGLLAALVGQLRFQAAVRRQQTLAGFAHQTCFLDVDALFRLRVLAGEVSTSDAAAWEAMLERAGGRDALDEDDDLRAPRRRRRRRER